MTNNFTNPVAKFSATLATGAMLMLSTTTASFAEKETVKYLDNALGRFQDCLLTEGNTGIETATTISCTANGQTTTCDIGDTSDTACETDVVEETGRGTGGKSHTSSGPFSGGLSSGIPKGAGTKPVPGQFIMQYSLQN